MKRAEFLRYAALTMGFILAAPPAFAITEARFTPQSLADAQKAGKPILVHISAPWCPTCAKHHPILESLKADPAFRDMVMLDVDFDSQKDDVRTLGANMQSTLIVYRGAAEKGRSGGDTNAAPIRTLLAKSAS
jgi:thioredoxin 1